MDHARTRAFAKRGGHLVRVCLEDVPIQTHPREVEVLALDEALDRLARLDDRKSRVVELRYFGGLSIEEAAITLGVSVETAKRDWRIAKAWLASELGST